MSTTTARSCGARSCGFYIIEADSIDDAVSWARRGRFMVGANEVRQIHGD